MYAACRRSASLVVSLLMVMSFAASSTSASARLLFSMALACLLAAITRSLRFLAAASASALLRSRRCAGFDIQKARFPLVTMSRSCTSSSHRFMRSHVRSAGSPSRLVSLKITFLNHVR